MTSPPEEEGPPREDAYQDLEPSRHEDTYQDLEPSRLYPSAGGREQRKLRAKERRRRRVGPLPLH